MRARVDDDSFGLLLRTIAGGILRDGHWQVQTLVEGPDGGRGQVSTIRLPGDHGPNEKGLALWYETLVFEVREDGFPVDFIERYGERYTTREQALSGHWRICGAVAAGGVDLKLRGTRWARTRLRAIG